MGLYDEDELTEEELTYDERSTYDDELTEDEDDLTYDDESAYDEESDYGEEEKRGIKKFYYSIKKNAKYLRDSIDEKTKNKGKKISKKLDKLLDAAGFNNEPSAAKRGEDILFNSEEIKNSQKEAAQQKSKKIQARKELEEKDYSVKTLETDLAELEKMKDELEKKLDKTTITRDDGRETKLDAETAKLTVNREMGKKALRYIAKRAEHLRKTDTQQKAEGYDYTKVALQEAFESSAEGSRARYFIVAAQDEYKTQQTSEMGVLTNIIDTIGYYEGRRRDEDELIAASSNAEDKEIIRRNKDAKYGDAAEKDEAATKALECAKKRADYLRANDETPGTADDEKDYIQMALNEAKELAGFGSGKAIAIAPGSQGGTAFEPLEDKLQDDDERKTKIGEILEMAENKYKAEKQKIQEEIEAKARRKQAKYDVAARTEEALRDLNKKRDDLEKAREEYKDDPGMAKWYEEEIKKVDAQRAETALKTRQSVEAAKAKKEKKNRAKEKEREKQAALEAERKIEEAQAKARAAIDEKFKEASQLEATTKGQSDEETTTEQQTTATTQTDPMENFLLSITPISISPSAIAKSRHSISFFDDEDDYEDDYEDDENAELSKKESDENYQKSKKAIKSIRPIGEMSKVMNSYIDNLKAEVSDTHSGKNDALLKRIHQWHKNREDKQNQLPIIKTLQKEINGHFSFHSPTIKKLEESVKNKKSQWDSNIPYILEVSSLIDKIHTSLNDARLQLSKKYPGTAKKIENIMNTKLHAPLFDKVAKQFLLNHQITMKDHFGQDVIDKETGEAMLFNPFSRPKYYHSSSANRTNSKHSKSTNAGSCYMGALRTMINVCNAQTKIDAESSPIVKKFVSICKNQLEIAHTLRDNQIKTYSDKLRLEITNEKIQKLQSNSSNTNQSKNASKISDILSLLKELSHKPSDAKTIKEIQVSLKKLNNFSNLGIGEENEMKYLTGLFEHGYPYEYLKEK